MRMVLIFRGIHTLFAVYFVFCLFYLYWSLVMPHDSRLLFIAVTSLILEGIAVFLNGGDCPLAIFHRKYGDTKDFFELFLPSTWAKRAIPFFAVVACIGTLLLLAEELL